MVRALSLTVRVRYTVAGQLLLLLPLTAASAAELRETAGLREGSHDSGSICLLGDMYFRQAKFQKAEQCYREAAGMDPENARAHFGLGRIARLQFQRKAAREDFATAFRLDSRDPDILLAYSEYASDPQVRASLFTTFLAVVEPEDPRIPDVLAKLQIDKAAGSRTLNRLASPYRGYRLKMAPFFPANSTPSGAVLRVSLNGSKSLRLVFDTGAKGVVVSDRSVRDLGLEFIVDSQIGGLGASALKTARVALADSLSIEDFRLENCLIEVTEQSIFPGVDGIIGADVFQEFLLRLDAWAQQLELLPFPDHVPAMENRPDPWLGYDAPLEARRAAFTPAYRIGHLLAVHSAVDGKGDGLFVLDTGSAYNSVSPALLCNLRQTASGISLRGAQGTVRTMLAASPVEFRLSGGPRLSDPNVIALDLDAMSRKEGVKISGLLGYSAISRLALTIDYRRGMVQFAPHQRR